MTTPSDWPAGQLQVELRRWFGFDAFRPHQEEVIRQVLAGQHLLVVMPTGSGKSLCYQLPALLLPGLTVVVSPLIALMKDQVDFLNDRVPDAATSIHSGLTAGEAQARWQAARQGRHRLLYLSPERLRMEAWVEGLEQVGVSRLVVDEAHCVSEWGHDFRPDYLRLRAIHERLGRPPLLALTATATPEVQDDIPRQLGLPEMGRVVAGFNRANLSFEVRSTPGDALKLRALERFLSEVTGSGIVYVPTRREADVFADFVHSVAGRRAAAYHAGLPPERRTQVQDAFMADRLQVVAATSAFGMGIDKPNLRFVVHAALPGSLEAYYQQVGRAGRDGRFSRCLLLYDPDDRFVHEQFIESDAPTSEDLRTLLRAVQREARGERATVSFEELEYATGLPDVKIQVGLRQLETVGAVVWLGNLPEGVELELRAAELTAEAMKENEEAWRRRREARRRRLQAMIEYAETGECRRAFLLRYFADPEETRYQVFCCDNHGSPLVAAEGVDRRALSHRAPQRVLAALQDDSLSRARLIQRAAQQEVEQAELSAEQARTQPLSWWSAVVEELLLAGLLKAHGVRPVRLALSPAGRRALVEGWTLHLPVPSFSPGEAIAQEPRESVTEFLSGDRPVPLYGNWSDGYALGFSSAFSGRQRERTEIGEWVYRLKYQSEQSYAERIAERMAGFLRQNPAWLELDCLVPIPPSRTDRPFDPVSALVAALSRRTALPVQFGALARVRTARPQKDMVTPAQKEANVRAVFQVPFPHRLQGRRVLLIDDFCDSGATLREATQVLLEAGVAEVRVLTAAKTIHH